MANPPIRAYVLRPIVDHDSGQTILETNDCGEVQGFELDSGAPAYIPTRNFPDAQLNRRLKFEVKFATNTYRLLYPEEVQFRDRDGLARALMEGANILSVTDISPTPQFQSVVRRPFAITLQLDNGLKITFLVDNTSGLLDMEVVACESS